MQKSIVEINGITYMSPAAAADKWSNISRQKIVAECKAGKVIGACVDSSNKWIIPIDAHPPIDDESIRKVLISLLCLKNKPDIQMVDINKNQIELVVDYLRKTGYLESNNDVETSELKDLVLTDKGIHVATEGKQMNLDWVNAGATLIQVIGSIASIISAFK